MLQNLNDLTDITYADVLREQIRRADEPYRDYAPIGKVEQFLNQMGTGNYMINLLSAANGIGKTTVLANIAANVIWPSSNQYFQQPLFKNWPYPVKSARIISQHTALSESIIPKLAQWFPAGRYELKKMGKQYYSKAVTDNGWDIDLMTYDQPIDQFESADKSLIICDEPPPRDVFTASLARLRRGGIIVIGETPLDGSAWIYDDIICNQNNEERSTQFMTADIEDACKEHGIRGFLDHTTIEDMLKLMKEDEKQARAWGRFQHLIGLIFKQWERKIHVIPPFEIDPNNFVVIESIDPHPRNPDAVAWVAIDSQGRYYLIGEEYRHFKTRELADTVKARTSAWRVTNRIMDPSAWIDDQHRESDNALARKLAKLGLSYDPGSKRRLDAIGAMGDALNYQLINGEYAKFPNLYVFSSCTRFIWEIEHYLWDDWRGRTNERKGQREQPVDKDDHMLEAVGRVLVGGFKYVPPPSQVITYQPSVFDLPQQVRKSNPYDPYE